MLPYYLLTIFVAVFGIALCERRKSPKNDLIFLLVVTVAMAAMASLRAESVGIDYEPYVEYFRLVSQKDLSWLFSTDNGYYREVLYGLLNWLVSRLTDNAAVFMGVMSSLIIVLRAVAVRRISSSAWASMFIYASFGFFGYALCTLRQELAISIVMFAVPYLQRKRPIPYFLLVLAAGLFHKSLFIMIPAYWLAWLPLNRVTFSLYGAGTVVGVAVAKPLVLYITEHYFTYYALGSEGERFLLRGRSLQTAIIPILVCMVALIFMKRLIARKPGNLVLINFSIWSAILFVFTLNSFIYQRLALIFLPLAAMLLLPELLCAVAPAPEAFARLEALKKDGSPSGRKQYVGLKNELRDIQMLYYGAIGFLLAAGFIYQAFLLEANRLLLVPYLTLFA